MSTTTIGEISDVLLDKDGHVRAAMLSVLRGFLGLGVKCVSVPFNACVWRKDGKCYLVMDTTKDALIEHAWLSIRQDQRSVGRKLSSSTCLLSSETDAHSAVGLLG
jgi:PRC-barrel domain